MSIIKAAILDAMQAADEIGGPDDPIEYISLMQEIAAEASRRASVCRKHAGVNTDPMQPLQTAIQAAHAASDAILAAHNAAIGPAQIILMDLISQSRDTANDLEVLATYLEQ